MLCGAYNTFAVVPLSIQQQRIFYVLAAEVSVSGLKHYFPTIIPLLYISAYADATLEAGTTNNSHFYRAMPRS